MNKLLILLLLCIVTLPFINTIGADKIIVNPDTYFKVDNIIYTFNNTMTFNTVDQQDSFIIFNTTSIIINSANNINITLKSLITNPLTANQGDVLLTFDANTTGGNVEFIISGFNPGQEYVIKRNDSIIDSVIATNLGVITFNNNVWDTTKKIEIISDHIDIVACISYVIDGANVHASSCSRNTNIYTQYKWDSSTDGTNYGSTGWINDTSGETHIFTYPEDGNICIRLTVKNQDNVEDIAIQCFGDFKTNLDVYPPGFYNVKTACEDAGYYWYNGVCNEDPEPLPWNVKDEPYEAGLHDSSMISLGGWKVHWGYLAIAGLALLIILLVKKKKKKRR